jgi:hypothetical protein
MMKFSRNIKDATDTVKTASASIKRGANATFIASAIACVVAVIALIVSVFK